MYSDESEKSYSRPKTPDASEAYRQFKMREIPELSDSEVEQVLCNNRDDPSASLDELFKCIYEYEPLTIELDTRLEPFVPDYVPAIGDIDAFIKVPRPDGLETRLGLEILDEPDIQQSNPTILEIKLKSLSKSSVGTKVRAIQDTKALKSDPKLLNNWIESLEELRQTRPACVVKYARPMPEIEQLMQAWDPETEQALQRVLIPVAKNQVPLDQLSRMVLASLDIPVKQDDSNGRSLIESLHVLFTLYSAFTQSHHFQ